MEKLNKYCLRLADNAFILSHRLGEYSSKGPYLEEDLALTNIALDLIGQADALYEYVSKLFNDGRSEDDFAYKRPENEYLNFQIVEQENKDFAYIMVRQFFMDIYNHALYEGLSKSKDPTLSAVAIKSLKEITYHKRRSSEWIIRLGLGTDESKERTQNAIDNLWKFTGELFETDEVELELCRLNVCPDMNDIKKTWTKEVHKIFDFAKLDVPSNNYMISGGRNGFHSEYMGFIISEMQYLNRTYPDAIW